MAPCVKPLVKMSDMGKSAPQRRQAASVRRRSSAKETPGKCKGKIMKSAAALCFVLLIGSFHGANAQKTALPPVDFSAMTCDQFWEKTPPNDRGPFLFWLSGYFGHKNNSAVLDPTGFTEKTKALSQYCTKQPNDNILSAAEKAFAN
jgi:HdeA/HdeB family